MQDYSDYWFKSSDGLRLYARDYQHKSPRATLLCIAGLTRNSADFSQLCDHLATQYRVIAVDLRGRGRSEYDPDPQNYHPGTYVNDIIALLDSLELKSVILIGTSLGGLVSMMLSAMQPQRISAVIINDIGPETNPAGIERIKSYVCKPTPVSSWQQAVDKTREILGREYPGFTDDDWLTFTRNLYREGSNGYPVLNYDPGICVLLQQQQDNAVAPDLWPLFNTLKSIPLLLFRGRLSDILTAECADKIKRKKPDTHYIEVPDCGHAPTLTEPGSIQAIDRFLDSLPIDSP